MQRGSSHVCCKFFQQIHPIFQDHRNMHNRQPRHQTKQMPRKKSLVGQCKYTNENFKIQKFKIQGHFRSDTEHRISVKIILIF